MDAPAWLRYANQGATRRLPLNSDLVNALGRVAPDLGLAVEVFSGGQPAKGSGGARVGSVRHDHGNAADVFFHKDGRRLDWANPQDQPIFQDFVRRAKAAGITGIGAGPGYMQPGSMHIGFGSPGVWGAGGKSANAPEWLRQAYGGGPAGPSPTQMARAVSQPSAPPAGPAPQMPASVAGLYGAAGPAPGPMAPPNPLEPGPANFSQLALLFAQQQAERQQTRQAEAEAEATRRAALFDTGGIFGIYS